jgi:plasmid stability protein
MASITIRNIPVATHDALVARAAASGQSLQQYLRGELIRLAEQPDTTAILEPVSRHHSNASILDLLDDDRR